MSGYPGIALTGIGLISPLGTDKGEFFRYISDAVMDAGKAEELKGLEPGQLVKRLNIADPKLKIARYMDPVSKNAIIAMREALSDADLKEELISEDPYGYGLILGATRGPCVTREGLYGSLASRQGKMVSGTLFSHCGYNIAGAMTAIAYGIKGPNITVAGRGDLGLTILRRARQFLMSGRVHTIFVGFSECGGVLRKAGRAFGEAACFLCLEKRERAAQRGARILAEVSEDEDAGLFEGKSFAVVGLRAGDPETFRLPLTGMSAVGERFSTLIMLGLLSNDREIRDRFSSSVFPVETGKGLSAVRLVYNGSEKSGS